MQDGFQLLTGGGLGEDDLRQRHAIQFATGGQHGGAKGAGNFCEGRLAGLDLLTKSMPNTPLRGTARTLADRERQRSAEETT